MKLWENKNYEKLYKKSKGYFWRNYEEKMKLKKYEVKWNTMRRKIVVNYKSEKLPREKLKRENLNIEKFMRTIKKWKNEMKIEGVLNIFWKFSGQSEFVLEKFWIMSKILVVRLIIYGIIWILGRMW